MHTHLPTWGPAAAPSLHALRGIRYFDGEAGAAGGSDPATPPAGTDPAAGTGTATGTAPGTATGTATAPDAGSTGTDPGSESIDSLPAWAQRIIRDTRKEAGDYRTKAKATEDSLTALREQTAIALGLKQPAAAADPALTAAQQQAHQAATHLAVYRAAGTQGVNADALLDSSTFLASVAALDHTASTFPADVAAAITAAAQANPLLRTARAAGASAPDTPAGGTGEQGAITEAALASMSPEQIVQALESGRLKHLL